MAKRNKGEKWYEVLIEWKRTRRAARRFRRTSYPTLIDAASGMMRDWMEEDAKAPHWLRASMEAMGDASPCSLVMEVTR